MKNVKKILKYYNRILSRSKKIVLKNLKFVDTGWFAKLAKFTKRFNSL